MLKWSPEPFEAEAAVPNSPVVAAEDFEATGAAVVDNVTESGGPREFRREAGFVDAKSLMNSLTTEERGQVYELVELALAKAYDVREKGLITELEQRLADEQAAARTQMEFWSEQIAAALNQELKDAAVAAARLSMQLAEKIVRQAVAADPVALVRVIETTLFKINESTPLTIRANPEDTAWLEAQTGLVERLNIGQIVSDRRIDAGGCVIQCEGREWDATLTRQLDTLNDLVAEMIATASENEGPLGGVTSAPDEPTPATETEVDDVPGVE